MDDTVETSHAMPDERKLPADGLIILPTRNTVLFPGLVIPLTIGRPQSQAAAQEAARAEQALGVILQSDSNIDIPGEEHLYRVGSAAEILRYVTSADGTHHLVVRGKHRFKIDEFLSGYQFLAARVTNITEPDGTAPEIQARMHVLRQRAHEALDLLPTIPPEVAQAIESLDSATSLADYVAGLIDATPAEKQQILESVDILERLDKLLDLIHRRLQVLRLSKEIGQRTEESLTAQQREHILREQLRQIQKQLGEGRERAEEMQELSRAITKAGMPQEAEEQALKELARLERTSEASGEYTMLRTYLDWLVELPWSKFDEEWIEITDAGRILDQDHFDLDKVKRRILEFLAVRQLNPAGKGPILCFVGPPGVGKTSVGQSIARATGRKFTRLSLGGVHDEAEIRGHRRTYIGALPGNIIQAIRHAGTRNPVFMLDEMDKLGAGFHGNPSSALLEVLDPEQNSTFRDNYLAVPFDLSKVMFIGTANVTDEIPGPLLDRMEIISLPGYTEDEKVEIAKRYLLARQIAAAGLTAEQCEITEAALRTVIRHYTREAGCRNLEREIGKVCRSVAMRFAQEKTDNVRINPEVLPAVLGPHRFENEVAMRTSVPGVATGLAWTPAGGDILFIEAARFLGDGKLILTGQLGDVMKESAQAALSLVKSRAGDMLIDLDDLKNLDIHIHVPAGAIPKDGPSAGITMYTALVSLLTRRVVRNDTAMTGEISLRGLVLPIGGVKEKLLAAVRAGITTVLLPERNKKDLEDVPEEVQARVRFVWLKTVDNATEAALAPRREE